jgi:hypothetical protein
MSRINSPLRRYQVILEKCGDIHLKLRSDFPNLLSAVVSISNFNPLVENFCWVFSVKVLEKVPLCEKSTH